MQGRIAVDHVVVDADPYVVALLDAYGGAWSGAVDEGGHARGAVCGEGAVGDAQDVVWLPCECRREREKEKERLAKHDGGRGG